MDIVEVNYNVDSDDFTIVFGVFNNENEIIAEVSQKISLKDAKQLPNYDFIKAILEAVKQDTIKGLN
jgi:hypothetical protein